MIAGLQADIGHFAIKVDHILRPHLEVEKALLVPFADLFHVSAITQPFEAALGIALIQLVERLDEFGRALLEFKANPMVDGVDQLLQVDPGKRRHGQDVGLAQLIPEMDGRAGLAIAIRPDDRADSAGLVLGDHAFEIL